jgi:hypothetical protein
MEHLPDRTMRATFSLCASGERSTRVFAMAVGLHNVPSAAQRRQVKREKDRLFKYMRRNKAIQTIVNGGASLEDRR